MYKRGEKTKEKNFLREKVKFNIRFDGQWNVIPNCSHVNLGKVAVFACTNVQRDALSQAE